MADNLIFPIRFDFEEGVKAARKDSDKALEEIAKALSKNPVTIKLKLDQSEKATTALSGLKKEIADLNRQWNKLSASERGGAAGAQLISQYRLLSQESKNYTSTLNAAVKLEDRLAKEREKSANAAIKAAQKTREYSNELHSQESYVSRLVNRLAVYASFAAAGNFLTNIRETTAQFELQKVSLGAIIQDQQRANQIFAEIRSFALSSPLKILDLTKYTKQIAAYGIETKKLFGTTKMLADISVGLGVSLDRLALFYGQVFATGYLRASEIRQATEAGIPLVDKLAKKLSEANGKLVSAAEVMDLISKRAISFEQVEEVLQDMTSAGGEFYNMQVKQSQTLFGMWSKLGDAAAIMYDQIGNTSSVNAGMKTSIHILELMMRNWQTTATVIGSLTFGLATYALMLKNSAIASKALTVTEGARLAITKAQVITTPKLVAGIISQNAATKLSAVLTKAHTAAIMKQSVATNVLSRAFWKLTAAMLANPWALVAGLAVAAGYAIYKFASASETAAERAEQLNNSVASLKNLEDTTKPLIDTYNELINKTERTAEEQKKLSDTTRELAKQYPGAITAVGNFGEEVDLATDKLNEFYQAEKQAKMDNTRYELQKTEEEIASIEDHITRLQKYLSEGKMWIGNRGAFGGGGVVVAMSNKEKGRVLKQIDILRYGEDGQGGLFGLQQAAEESRRALGLIPSEATQSVEKFGAWKKTFTTFTKQVGNTKVQLFDDSTIAQLSSLDEALKKTADEYKRNIALVQFYNNVLNSSTLSEEERAKIEERRAEADAMANLSQEALKYYNVLSLLSKGSSDTRLSILQKMASTLKKINKEYDDLASKEGATNALADTQRVYADTFKDMQELAKKYKFTLPDLDIPTDTSSLTNYLYAIREAMKKLPESDKAVLELQIEIDKLGLNEQQKNIEAQMKQLADRISRTKTAKEFYDRVLNSTGDYELAVKMSLSIYGSNGDDLQKQIAEQIRQYFKDSEGKLAIEIPAEVIGKDEKINFLNLRALAQEAYDAKKIGQNAYDALLKIADQGQNDLAKIYDSYLKDIEKAKTYADKRVELARTTAAKIKAIEADIAAGRTDESVGKYAIKELRDSEDREATKLEYDAFKETPLYIQMFEDLERTSTSTLESMKQKLLSMKEVWGASLDPTQLKEMQSRLNEIDVQLRQRNPFKSLREAYINYRDTVNDYSISGAETNVATAQGNYDAIVKEKGVDSKEAQAAAKTLAIEKQRLEIVRQLTDEQGKRLRGQKSIDMAAEIANKNEAQKRIELAEALAAEKNATTDTEKADAHTQVESKKEELKLAQKTSKIVQQDANASKTLKDSLVATGDQIAQGLNAASDLARGIADLTADFGGSEEDVQYWNDIADSIGQVNSAIGDVVQSAMSGDIAGLVSSSLLLVPKMISGFIGIFSAGKVKRASKEIKRQQEMLKQLEYTYGRLEKAADKALGSDYVKNINEQTKNLEARQQAYLAQARAEQSKGKKEDKAKTQEYLDNARDIADQLADMQGKIVEQMMGTDVASAARKFASAWLEAKLSFGNTKTAIEKEFKDMIKTMVTESATARLVQSFLDPFFKEIDEMYASSGDMETVIGYALDKVPQLTSEISNGLEAWYEGMTKRGYDLNKALGDSEDGLTGISRDIASASEESINGLAAGINTQNYYISYVPLIAEHVAAMRIMMESGMFSIPLAEGAAGWTDWQKQAMDNYMAVRRNTAETVAECRRIAVACEEEVAQLRRVIVPKGSKATHGIQVYL